MPSHSQASSPVPLPAPHASPGNRPQVLDPEALLNFAGKDLEFLRKLIEVFLAESPGLLSVIRSGIAELKPEPVERSAHTLRNALAKFGARRASEAALEIELRAREARLEDAARLFLILEGEVAAACNALSEFLRQPESEASRR